MIMMRNILSIFKSEVLRVETKKDVKTIKINPAQMQMMSGKEPKIKSKLFLTSEEICKFLNSKIGRRPVTIISTNKDNFILFYADMQDFKVEDKNE